MKSGGGCQGAAALDLHTGPWGLDLQYIRKGRITELLRKVRGAGWLRDSLLLRKAVRRIQFLYEQGVASQCLWDIESCMQRQTLVSVCD